MASPRALFTAPVRPSGVGSFLALCQAYLLGEQREDTRDVGRSSDGEKPMSRGLILYLRPQVSYNVSKSAVMAMVKSLAAEWAYMGIRVNSISPGYMDTVLNEGIGLDNARNIWLSRNPMRRMGQPDELTGAIVLLASRAGSYINGADIVIDGGQTLF